MSPVISGEVLLLVRFVLGIGAMELTPGEAPWLPNVPRQESFAVRSALDLLEPHVAATEAYRSKSFIAIIREVARRNLSPVQRGQANRPIIPSTLFLFVESVLLDEGRP